MLQRLGVGLMGSWTLWSGLAELHLISLTNEAPASMLPAASKSPTRQVPPPKRYGTQREGGSQRYGDGA